VFLFAKYVSVFLFVIYWVLTVTFTFQDNYIKLSFLEYESNFQSLFYQNWSFFAPPPQFNEKLIYVFRFRETEKIRTFEALRQITAQKQKAAPFNTEEEIMDYLVSGSVNTVVNYFARQMDRIKTQFPDSTSTFYNKQLNKEVWTDSIHFRINNLGSAATLYNYGKIVAAKNGLSNEYQMKVIIGRVAIPKFADRLLPEQKETIEIVSESPYYSL
jgi:hypothetical protein